MTARHRYERPKISANAARNGISTSEKRRMRRTDRGEYCGSEQGVIGDAAPATPAGLLDRNVRGEEAVGKQRRRNSCALGALADATRERGVWLLGLRRE